MGRLLPLLFLFLLPLALGGGPLNMQENIYLQANCGKFTVPPPPSPRYRSMNTPKATREEAPWAVALRYFTPTQDGKDNSTGHCTGSLISSRHVITAAHCVPVRRYCGSNQQAAPSFKSLVIMTSASCEMANTTSLVSCDSTLKNGHIRVKQAYVSRYWSKCPGYRGRRGDVAILELEEDIVFNDRIQPVCLDTLPPIPGTNLTMFGYGNAFDRPKPVGYDVLRKLSTSIVSWDECKAYSLQHWKSNETVDTFCSRDVKEFACHGDSGSGQTLIKEGKAFLTGVLSSGKFCEPNMQSEDIMDFNSGTMTHNRWIAAATGVNPGYPLSPNEKSIVTQEYFEFGVEE